MTDDLVERVAKAMCGCEGICFTSCGTEPCQMAEENYAKAARAAIAVVLEEAAKVADGVGQQPPTDNFMHDTGWDGASLVIAAAIRALVKEPQP